ncbi:MAG: Holliday junction branch migration protein RuvA [Firmicutes bacterium]|nr:Holliday junction branch migration protein RuvA [Bacillota bacterium]
MFRYIKGTIEMKLAQSVVVECGGVGFEMAVPQNSRLYLAPEGSEVTVFTYMSVREDDISLFGFDDEDGLLLFEKLITVNGIGAKAAMAILSAMPASEVKKAIVFEDADMLTRANGIGKKTAQRIVLELKDKMKDITVEDLPGADIAPAASSSDKQQATDALMALGYSRTEAAAALVGAEDGLSVEDYIKIALKNK